jgi:WD40 repeat protein
MFEPRRLTKQHQLTGHESGIYALCPGPGEREWLSGDGAGWIVRWRLDDPETGRLLARVENRVFSLAYLPDHELIVAGNMDGGLHWIPLADPDDNVNIAHHRRGLFSILAIGDQLFTAGGDGFLSRWDIASRRRLESLQLATDSLRSLAYSPSRNELAVGSSDNTIYLLDATDLRLKSQLRGHANSVFSVHYLPGGRFLFSGGRDAYLRIWDLAAERELTAGDAAHWFTVNALALHPEGRYLATGSRDKTIKIWDTETFALQKVLDTIRDGGHINSVNTLLWHPTGALISAGDDRSIILWADPEA